MFKNPAPVCCCCSTEDGTRDEVAQVDEGLQKGAGSWVYAGFTKLLGGCRLYGAKFLPCLGCVSACLVEAG